MNGRSRIIVTIGVGITSLMGSALAEPLVTETVVEAPVDEVWNAFTTEDGMTSWMVPHARIDLRVGGKILTNYHADGKLGDENTIENTILSYEPNRMLSLKATKLPADFPFKDAIKDMWSVIHFESLPDGRTRVRTVGLGYRSDEESQRLRGFFEQGNAWTLEQLRKHFANGPSDSNGGATATRPAPPDKDAGASGTLRLLRSLTGGEWIHESMHEDGTSFLVRNVIRQGPHESCLVADAWLGDEHGMLYHGHTQIWTEPESRALRFQNINERGAVSRGQIWSEEDNRLLWDWGLTEPDGGNTQYEVSMVILGTDRYRFVLTRMLPNGDREQKVDAVFRRVAQAPDRFRMLRDKQ